MSLTDISYIKEQMQRFGLNFKKKFGQNFLTNPLVVENIAREAPEGVLEIGPGLGVLTHELARFAKKVVAIEIDSSLIPLLEENLAEYDNLEIINSDVMKLDIKALIEEKFSDCSSVGVCANLPYYITTPVIMKILESKAGLESIVIMIQKEVAQRLCAKPGTAEYGAITAAVSYYGRCERLFDVSAGNFIPKPNVDSAVVKIALHKSPPADVDEKTLMRVIKGAFAQRRKMLSNSLATEFFEHSKQEIAEIITECGFDSKIRGEALSLDDFAKIAVKINSL